MKMIKQQSNTYFIFRCGHRAVLPNLGESSNDVFWHKDFKNRRGGCWVCKYCSLVKNKVWRNKNSESLKIKRDKNPRVKIMKEKYRLGTGPQGLLSRMKHLLGISKYRSRQEKYLPPNTTPEDMVYQWVSQKGFCAACKEPIDLLKTHFDHDHKTGEPRGFVHPVCNMIEGFISKMSDDIFIRCVNFYIPRMPANEKTIS